MKVKVVLANKVKKQVYDEHIKPLIDKIEDEHQDAKMFECIGIIDPFNYRAIVELLQGENAKVKQGEGSIEVIDMAAVKE